MFRMPWLPSLLSVVSMSFFHKILHRDILRYLQRGFSLHWMQNRPEPVYAYERNKCTESYLHRFLRSSSHTITSSKWGRAATLWEHNSFYAVWCIYKCHQRRGLEKHWALWSVIYTQTINGWNQDGTCRHPCFHLFWCIPFAFNRGLHSHMLGF
jgi:hypothetical protein